MLVQGVLLLLLYDGAINELKLEYNASLEAVVNVCKVPWLACQVGVIMAICFQQINGGYKRTVQYIDKYNHIDY